jgi:hypothetical protein
MNPRRLAFPAGRGRPGLGWVCAAGLLVAFSAGAAAPSGAPTGLPGPTLSADALRSKLGNAHSATSTPKSDDCVQCHSDIAEEWRSSLHRNSWQDPVFQSAYAVEPLAFCRGCHAPTSDPAKAPSAEAAGNGVDCVACHVQGGGIAGPGQHAAMAAHPVLADVRLGTEAACAGCHQFDFPKVSRQVVPQAMQNTVREHAQSRFSSTPCQSCHMPVVGTGPGAHRSHDFSVIGNAAMIRRAATVEASLVAASEVAVVVTAAAVGHAFPTGDMFRRLEVRADVRDTRGATTGTLRPVMLARRFGDVPRGGPGSALGFQRVQTGDDRVTPPGAGPARRVTFTVPPSPSAARVHYQVVYQRMSAPMASAFRIDRALDEIVLAEGDVALATTPSASSSREKHP